MDVKKQIKFLIELFKVDSKLLEIESSIEKLSKFFENIKKNAFLIKNKSIDLEKIKIKKIKERKLCSELLILERAKLKKWKERSEKIKNEREYSALMLEIHNQKKTIIEIEENGLRISKKIQKSEIGLNNYGEESEKIDILSRRENNKIKDNLSNLKIKKNRLCEKKKIIISQLDKLIFLKYEKIFKHKNGCAISYVLNDVCQGCMRYIPPILSQKIGLYESIEYCPSCCRLLLVEE